MFARIARSLERLTKRQCFRDCTLETTADGVRAFNASNDQTIWEFAWLDIERVVAYKVDLLTTDCICVAFRHTKLETYFICHEEHAGWPELLNGIQNQYGPDVVDRIQSIAFPPFVESKVVAWPNCETHESTDATEQSDAAEP